MKKQNVVVLSDVHFPYHDPHAWQLALTVIHALQPDTVLLNGDIIDFYPVSPFDKDPKRVVALDYDVGVAFAGIEDVRRAASNAQLLYLPGNHEAWLRKYGWKKAKALARGLDIPGLFRLFNHDLAKLDVRMLPEGQVHTIGELHFAHGHEFGIRSSKHPATATLNRVLGNILVGHWHVEDTADLRLLNGKCYGAWVNPCLCTLEPEYTLHPQWVQGLSRVDFTVAGTFHVDTFKFFGQNKQLGVVVDGRFFLSAVDKKQRSRHKLA